METLDLKSIICYLINNKLLLLHFSSLYDWGLYLITIPECYFRRFVLLFINDMENYSVLTP